MERECGSKESGMTNRVKVKKEGKRGWESELNKWGEKSGVGKWKVKMQWEIETENITRNWREKMKWENKERKRLRILS